MAVYKNHEGGLEDRITESEEGGVFVLVPVIAGAPERALLRLEEGMAGAG